ncbi:hypothetical protein ACJMK2_025558 [Sinanodonta woodiana]|uniref:Uncharacterized protein n=1 Tax=Sinanodonta woodiana TaxID=1069815 RepID=A0ABD3XKM4_SINWO
MDNSKVVLRFPLVLKNMFEEETGEDLQAAIKQTTRSEQIILSSDKLRVDARILKSFFDEATRSVEDVVLQACVEGRLSNSFGWRVFRVKDASTCNSKRIYKGNNRCSA